VAEHDSDHEPEERGLPLDEDAAWAAIVAGYGEEPPDPPGAKPFKPFRPVRPVRPVEDVSLPEPPGPAAGPGAAEGPGAAGTPRGDTTTGGGTGTSGGATGSGGSAGAGPGAVTGPGGIGSPGSDGGPGSVGIPGNTGAATAPGAGDAPGSSGDDAPSSTGDGGPPRTGRPGGTLGGSISFAPGVGPRDHSPPSGPHGDDDEGHFVPPEPPPLPASDTTARFAWLGAVGGPILLLLAVLLGWDMTWWLTTACIGGFLGGCATLVVRMHPGDEDDDDPGRGAVV